MAYLQHALENHGKKPKIGNRVVDGINILETWLATCNKRRWDFPFDLKADKLIEIAERNLKTLRERRGDK
jgi:hypothetical protein